MMESIDAFGLIDFRIGLIKRVEVNAEARKPAYKIWIDFGDLGLKTTSGQYTALYKPEDLLGKNVVCAVNLGTRRIAGFLSEVLMLGVQHAEGEVIYLTTERPVNAGSKVF
jgi:tRNA-binding protein